MLIRDLIDTKDNPTYIFWKLLKMSHLNFGIFINFCPIKTDPFGNTVWPQAVGFQKLVKLSILGIF